MALPTTLRVLCLISFLNVVGCSSTPGAGGVEQLPPANVILILTDDHGAHLSAMGTTGIKTPNIDSLARSGMLFTKAFAAVPSCSPSRSSINTGMFPHANGHWRNTVTPELSAGNEAFGHQATIVDEVGIHEYLTTLPEALQAAGYFTAITQKFHMSPPWKFPYSARNPVHNDPDEYRKVIVDFIDDSDEQPFFFQANISPPHRPFFKHLEAFPEYRVSPDSIDIPLDLADTPAMREDVAEYFGCVQLADACVGAIVEALREKGQLENTLIIFTGDQGQAYHRAKASAYYAGLHVPLIFSGPPVTSRGKHSDALVSLTDLMPTILDYLNLSIPASVQGASLLALIAGEDRNGPHEYIFGEHNSHGPARGEHYPTRIVFDGRFYYMENLLPHKDYALPADLRQEKGWGNHSYSATIAAEITHPEAYGLLRLLESGRPARELYDIDMDPFQLKNLAGEADYEEIESELSAELAEWRKATGDVEADPVDILTRQTSR